MILVFGFRTKTYKFWWISLLLILYFTDGAFQTVHSIATGNGVELQKKHWFVSKDYEKEKINTFFARNQQVIFPYFSGFKGNRWKFGLVDKEIQTENQERQNNYWKKCRRKKNRKYLLVSKNLFEERWKFYQENYRFIEGI